LGGDVTVLFRQGSVGFGGGGVFVGDGALVFKGVAGFRDLGGGVGGDAGFGGAAVAVGDQLIDTAGALFETGGAGVELGFDGLGFGEAGLGGSLGQNAVQSQGVNLRRQMFPHIQDIVTGNCPLPAISFID
jgi:hypothetical protein